MYRYLTPSCTWHSLSRNQQMIHVIIVLPARLQHGPLPLPLHELLLHCLIALPPVVAFPYPPTVSLLLLFVSALRPVALRLLLLYVSALRLLALLLPLLYVSALRPVFFVLPPYVCVLLPMQVVWLQTRFSTHQVGGVPVSLPVNPAPCYRLLSRNEQLLTI